MVDAYARRHNCQDAVAPVNLFLRASMSDVVKRRKPNDEALVMPYVPHGFLNGQKLTAENVNKADQRRTLCVRGLPSWVTDEDLQNLFIKAKQNLTELQSGSGVVHLHCVTKTDIARDPLTGQCVGYALVEFVDPETARVLLANLSGPDFLLPGSSRPLSLSWATGPTSNSSLLENYHLYIGNLRGGISEAEVAHILRTCNPRIHSVKLIPPEVLGPAPPYYDSRMRGVRQDEARLLANASIAFYEKKEMVALDEPLPRKLRAKRQLEAAQKSTSNLWSCGFLRIEEPHRDLHVLIEELRIRLNGEATFQPLRRPSQQDEQHPSVRAYSRPLKQSSSQNRIIVRPIFGAINHGPPSPSPATADSKKNIVTTTIVDTPYATAPPPSAPLARGTTLFIGNLSEETVEDDLALILSAFGRVLSIRVAHLKHVAFVEFADSRSALAALSHLSGCTFKKSKLQFDWGRIRPGGASAPRPMEPVDDHQTEAAETAYAVKLAQSMKPSSTSVSVDNSRPPLEDSPLEKAYWLTQFCASFPKPPIQIERACNNTSLSDGALLTFLTKSEGDLVKAKELYKQSVWAQLETNTTDGNLSRLLASARLPRPPPTRNKDPFESLVSADVSEERESVHYFELGVALVDVTCSIRLEIASLLGNDVSFHYTGLPPLRKTGSAFKKGKGGAGGQAESKVDQTLVALRENGTGTVTVGGRHVGRLPKDVTATIAPLVHLHLIKVVAHLAPDPPQKIDVGTSLPIFVSIALASTACSPWEQRFDIGAVGKAAVRDALVALLLTTLALTPSRVSLFWSSSGDDAGAGDGPDKVSDDGGREDLAEEKGDEEPLTEGEEDAAAAEATEHIFGGAGADPVCNDSPVSFPDVPHPDLFRATLRPYQLQGLSWMKRRELGGSGVVESEQQDGSSPLHPMWDEFEFPSSESDLNSRPQHFYFNRTTGQLLLHRPRNTPSCCGGLLADQMGLGKTVQTIALLALELTPFVDELHQTPDPQDKLLLLRRSRQTAIKRHLELARSFDETPDPPKDEDSSWLLEGGTLLVVPLSLIAQWKSEFAKHMQAGCSIILLDYYGNERPSDALSLTQADVVITSYGVVASEYSRTKKKMGGSGNGSPLWLVRWRRIVLDEAHLIKNRSTQSCRSVCTLESRSRWCLTGTPVQNSVEDVFSLLQFLKVDPWGVWTWWSKLVGVALKQKQIGKAIEAVRRITLPLMLRRTKESRDENGNPIIQLPPREDHLKILPLSPEEREFYDAVFHRVVDEFDSLVKAGNVFHHYTHVLELLLRLRQAACHPLLIYSGSTTNVLKSFDNLDALAARFLKRASRLGDSHAMSETFVKENLMQLMNHDKELSCPICFDTVEDPVILPCCHVLCRCCALSALKSKGNSSAPYPCPSCRTPFSKASLTAMPGATPLSKGVLTSLHDSAGNFRYSAKLKALETHLKEDLKTGLAVVVFSQWTSFLNILEVLMKDLEINFRRFDGSLNLSQRQEVLGWFSGGSGARVLLVSLKAGGIGLNLTAATRCYMMDPWWNPAVEEQAIQRIHRIGQTESVKVFRFIAAQTVEERIVELQTSKAQQASQALYGGERAALASFEPSIKLTISDLQKMFQQF